MPATASLQLVEAVVGRPDGAPVGERQRWSEEFKAKAVAAALEPGVNVSALARRLGISPRQLFGWRKIFLNNRSESGAAGSSAPVVETVVGEVVIQVSPDHEEAGCAILCVMRGDDLSLPDDMDLLKAMVCAMAERTAALGDENAALKACSLDADEWIKRLLHILKAYDRARFGRRSEKLGISGPSDDADAQQAFVLEETLTGIAALKAQVGKGRVSDQKRPPRPRKALPPHLERVEVAIEPEDLPEHAGKQKVLIGEDVSERLDVIAAKFRVIVTRHPKYAFKNADGVIQASPRPISSKSACRPRRCWRRSPSRNMPTACRSIVRRDLCPRPGGDRPAADGPMDGPDGLRAGDPG